jgi:ribonuclease HII
MSKKREERLAILTQTDAPLWEQGIVFAGMDEAGRGPLAGPVCAAAVILPPHAEIPGLNDSKKLSDKRRRELFPIIKEQAIAYGIGIATHEEIDEINILQATYLAMERAIHALNVKPELALIDGNRARDFVVPVQTVIKGDSLSASIAAASVLAKVTRDDMMLEYAKEYPQYGFEIHKGYGTKAHYAALDAHGVSPIHRDSFLKKYHGKK